MEKTDIFSAVLQDNFRTFRSNSGSIFKFPITINIVKTSFLGYFVLGKGNHVGYIIGNSEWDFIILVHFRALKLKMFFNHGKIVNKAFLEIFYFGAFSALASFFSIGKVLSEILPKSFISVHFRALKWKIFFKHGEILNQILPEIIHSCIFQSS